MLHLEPSRHQAQQFPIRPAIFPVLAALLFLILASAPVCPLLPVGTVRADIIPKNMKPVYITTVLENLADYPDHVFIQLETLGPDNIRQVKLLDAKGRIIKGYKLNQLFVLAVPRDVFRARTGATGKANATEPDLNKLDLLHDPAIARSKQPIEAGQELVPRTSSVAGKEIFYRVVSIADGTVRLEKTGEKIFQEHPNDFPLNLFAYGFGLTLAVELVVFILLLRLVFRLPRPGTLRAVFSVITAQVVTLPLLWLMITHYNLMGTPVMAGAEAFAVVAETIVYNRLAGLSWKRAFIAALVCNAASYMVGMTA